jgi:hypothetical protein
MTFCFLIVQNCKTPEENDQNMEKWTSSDPLVVNYRVREQKYLHNNLVINPSFEIGKVRKTDSAFYQANIDGWEIIGNNVKWTNPGIDSLNKNPYEVHSGLHSICVNRKRADETEEIGQGVLSDYIKVIPGNYLLTLYLNLKNIHNPKSRLGTKIFDAIDIRIMYYDRNKLQIKGEQYDPHFNTIFNNSFKGLSFSNFDKIDSTGWIHITGRSQLFPFPDGDLPDNSKFVRIFIGLKGTGTLWADDIRFEYTRYNFTTLERLDKFFDSTNTKSLSIIPQPRKVSPRESIIYYHPYTNSIFPLIIIPAAADKITMNAALKLESRIKELLERIENIDIAKIPELIKTDSEMNSTNTTMIFSIGNTNLFNRYKTKLPLNTILNQDDGYIVSTLDESPNTVFVYGNSPEADFYAIQSVIQLFDNRRTLFHNVNIIDYPANNKRAMLLPDFKVNAVDQFIASNNCRFNILYLPGNSDSIVSLGSKIKSQTISSKYLYFDVPGDSHNAVYATNLTQISNISSRIENNRQEIEGTAIFFNSPFATGISLEELMAQYSVEKQPGMEDFTLQPLISKLRENKLRFEILPYTSNNLYTNKFGRDRLTNDDMKVKNADIIWSGYGLQSWCMDEADLNYFKDAFLTTPVFLDLTMYSKDRKLDYFANDTASPYKLMTSSLFESYSNEIVPEIYAKVVKTILVYELTSVFERIRMQTASDFLWNPANYDPDLSMYRALIAEFGLDVSRDLVKFNDEYFKIRSEIILADNQKNKHRHLRRAFTLLDELKVLQNKLTTYPKTNSVTEMNSILDKLINELDNKMKGFQRPPLLNLKNYQP